jgi:hypothetical protein
LRHGGAGYSQQERLRLLIRPQAVQTTAYNTSSRQEFQSEIEENGRQFERQY